MMRPIGPCTSNIKEKKVKSHTSTFDVVFKFATAIIMVLALCAPVFSTKAYAAQINSRYIKMSSSAPGATGVTYEIGFTPTTSAFQSVVVEFCSNNPILITACTATAGTDTPSFGTAAPVGGGTAGTTDAWTAGNSASNVIKVNGASISTGAAQMFHVSGVTNPSATASFYARIYTFNSTTYTGFNTGGATVTTVIDSGGVALATATAISVNIKVQETLTFCVSKAAPGSSCSGTTSPILALGHGPNTVLDNTQVNSDTVYFQVSTNAGSSVIIRIKGSLLTNGGNTIAAANAGASTPGAIVAGTAGFGLRSDQGVDTGANTTIDANYAHATNYGYDTTTSTNNAISGYGDPLATVTAVANSNTMLTFAATASLTTPAGLYQSTQNLIATGTY